VEQFIRSEFSHLFLHSANSNTVKVNNDNNIGNSPTTGSYLDSNNEMKDIELNPPVIDLNPSAYCVHPFDFNVDLNQEIEPVDQINLTKRKQQDGDDKSPLQKKIKKNEEEKHILDKN